MIGAETRSVKEAATGVVRFLVCAFALATVASGVRASTGVVWTNTGGSWQEPGNWSPNIVPNGDFDVTIPAGGSPVLAADVMLNSLTNYGTISGENNIIVSNWFTMTDATLAGVGSLQAFGGMALAGADEIDQRIIDNSGVATWTATNTALVLSEGATINNLSNGVFRIVGDGTLASGNFPLGVFNNHGLLEKTAGNGVTAVQVEFGNSGVVELQSGTVSFQEYGFNSGTFDVSTNAECEFTFANLALAPGTVLSGEGLYSIDNSTAVTLTTSLTINRLRLNGFLTFSNTLTIGESLDFQGGQLGGLGITVFAPGSTVTFTNEGVREFNQQTINNSGTVVWGDDGQIVLNGGSVFNNLGGGVFDITGDGQMTNTFGAPGVFNNAGLFEKMAGSNTTVMHAFTNTGIVNLQSGTVDFADGYFQASGTTEMGSLSPTLGTYVGVDLQGDFCQAAGTTIMYYGTIYGSFTLQGGELDGGGTITSNFYNNATLSPFANGGFWVNGNYIQSTTATLNVIMDKWWYTRAGEGFASVNVWGGQNGGSPYYSPVPVGNASLSGTLHVTMSSNILDLGPYLSPVGYAVVDWSGAVTGKFDRVTVDGVFPQFAGNQILNAPAGPLLFVWYTAPQVASGSFSNGQFHIPLNAPDSETVLLEASTDMIHWSPVSTNAIGWSTNNLTDLVDTKAARFRSRFYRARITGYYDEAFP